MSATGRNLPGNEREENDFYETPAWVTQAILPHLCTPNTVLDAGAGRSWAITGECRKFWPEATVVGVDIDPAAASGVMGVFQADFLGVAHPPVDLVISNPPYKLAQQFVETALTCGTEVAFLLRLNWLASRKRLAFHRAHPADIYVLPKRPSFKANGKTDATEYAWFVWGGGRVGGHWSLLDVTPPGRHR